MRCAALLLLTMLAVMPAAERRADIAEGDYVGVVLAAVEQQAWLGPEEKSKLSQEATALTGRLFGSGKARNADPVKFQIFVSKFPGQLAMDRLGINPDPSSCHAEKVAYLRSRLAASLTVFLTIIPRDSAYCERIRRQSADLPNAWIKYMSARFPEAAESRPDEVRKIITESIGDLDRLLDDYFLLAGSLLDEKAIKRQIGGDFPAVPERNAKRVEDLRRRARDQGQNEKARSAAIAQLTELQLMELRQLCATCANQLIEQDEARANAAIDGSTFADIARLNDEQNAAMQALVEANRKKSGR